MMDSEMQQILHKVMAELPKMTWIRDTEMEANPEAVKYQGRCYIGRSEDWRLVVATFTIDGELGADGAATSMKAATVIRLTRELALKAAEVAAKAVP